MKKIIFNGCSFMAGDEIAWQEYLDEFKYPRVNYRDAMCNAGYYGFDFRKHPYTEFRNSYNLPKFTLTELNTNGVNISTDGNSNDTIAMSTISYILNLPEEERHGYHVVVGWSTLNRVFKWNVNTKLFTNLNIWHVLNSEIRVSTEDHLENFVKEVLIKGCNEDFSMNYIRNIILLETFLKQNSMTYTFYRALGSPMDFNHDPLVMYPIERNIVFPLNKVSENSNWVSFSNSDIFLWSGESWTSSVLDKDSTGGNFISRTNLHPNAKAVKQFASKLAEHIKINI